MSRISLVLLSALSVFLLFGCAIPQNPNEARAYYGPEPQEIVTVKQPYQVVMKSVENNSKRCLNRKVYEVSYDREPIAGDPFYQFTSKLQKGKGKSVLTLQVEFPNMIGSVPPGGHFYMVADISDNHQNTTANIYFTSVNNMELIIKALKGWMKGRNGCPDLAQFF